MRIVQIEVHHFRGIDRLLWKPGAGVNCLIGPGDSTKTTILDAIELALSPRANALAEDTDFYNLDTSIPLRICVTIADLPEEFKAEDKYGLHLRGWDPTTQCVTDEPGGPELGGLDALSIMVEARENLELRWSIHNDRVDATQNDPPYLRLKDAQRLTPVRLGPYADRHLTWGRQSILARMNPKRETLTAQLAESGRAAKTSFNGLETRPFADTAKQIEDFSKRFSVPVKDRFNAALDLQSSNITSGVVSLHDGKLPLRRLGTGSSRLLVASIQHGLGSNAPVALVDEIEHGLEPHRLARIIKFLKDGSRQVQSFLTSHSIVTIIESHAEDLVCVRSSNGETVARPLLEGKRRHLLHKYARSVPEAFLAASIIVCEGRTEMGLLRAFDDYWCQSGRESFALRGVVAVDGGGSETLGKTEALSSLGYRVYALIDSDKQPKTEDVSACQSLGAVVECWPDDCCLEQRIFLDMPIAAFSPVFQLANSNSAALIASINSHMRTQGLSDLSTLDMTDDTATPALRRALGYIAHKKEWFKGIELGQALGSTLLPHMPAMRGTPFSDGLEKLRKWIDAGN